MNDVFLVVVVFLKQPTVVLDLKSLKLKDFL